MSDILPEGARPPSPTREISCTLDLSFARRSHPADIVKVTARQDRIEGAGRKGRGNRMGNAGDMLERIQRIKVRRDDGTVRAEVALEGMSELSADVVLEAAEQLRQVLESLQITDLSMIPSDTGGRIEN